MPRSLICLVLVVGVFVSACDTTVVPPSPVAPTVSTRAPDPPIVREVQGACCFGFGCLELFPSMCADYGGFWIGGRREDANCPPREVTPPVTTEPIVVPPPDDDFVIVKCYKVDEDCVLYICDGKQVKSADGHVNPRIESCTNCVATLTLTPVPDNFNFGDINAGTSEWILRVAYMMYHCQQDGEGCDLYNQVHQIMEEMPRYNG